MSKQILTIGTWNIRGLNNDFKKEDLGIDCKKLNVDIMAIQESKIKEKWK